MTAPPLTSTGTLHHWIVDVGLRALIWSALKLPYNARVRAAGRVAALGIGRTRFACRIEDNLSYALPSLTEAERQRLSHAVATNVGRLMIENYSGAEVLARMAQVSPCGPGLEALARARADSRPVLLLTGHFGNYEAARACLIGQGYAVGGLYRPLANPYFNAHYVRTMERFGPPVFPQGREGTLGLMRFLKSGGMAMMLNDIYAGAGPELSFVGRPARTATSAAEMALRLRAALIPVYATRQPDGFTFTVDVETEIPPTDPVTMTQAYNDSVSARILAHPEQWYWVHRRWKRRRSDSQTTGERVPAALLPRGRGR